MGFEPNITFPGFLLIGVLALMAVIAFTVVGVIVYYIVWERRRHADPKHPHHQQS